jgi:hypothetical protein
MDLYIINFNQEKDISLKQILILFLKLPILDLHFTVVFLALILIMKNEKRYALFLEEIHFY